MQADTETTSSSCAAVRPYGLTTEPTSLSSRSPTTPRSSSFVMKSAQNVSSSDPLVNVIQTTAGKVKHMHPFALPTVCDSRKIQSSASFMFVSRRTTDQSHVGRSKRSQERVDFPIRRLQ